MYCDKCGKLIDNDAKFCPYCGAEIESQELEVQETEALEAEEVEDFNETQGERGPWKAFATIGYILGLLGFILSFITIGLEIAIPGLVFSILGKKTKDEEKYEKARKGFGFALAGIIIGFIASVILGIVLGILGFDSIYEFVEYYIEQFME